MSIRTESSPGMTVRTYVPQASFAVPLSIRLLCCWTHDECAFVQGSNGHFKSFESCDYATGHEFVRAVVARAQFLGIDDEFDDWRDRILV